MSYIRQLSNGEEEYSDGEFWFSDRNCCRHCRDECIATSSPFAWADECHSFGVYAGRYCASCWPKSGFKDADENYEPNRDDRLD